MTGPTDPTRRWVPPPSQPPEQPWWTKKPQRQQTPWWANQPERRRPPTAPAPRPEPSRPPPVQERKRSNRAVVIGGVAVGLVVGGALIVLPLWRSGYFAFNTTELDVGDTNADVRQILTDPTYGYGVENLTDVRCNDGRNPLVKKGSGFTCEVNVNGVQRHVAVVFLDDSGTYEVDRPR